MGGSGAGVRAFFFTTNHPNLKYFMGEEVGVGLGDGEGRGC